MQRIIIAIDGYSSSGKSTVAKQLAKALGYIYVDTGAMYRAVTLYGLRQGFLAPSDSNLDGLVQALNQVQLSFSKNPVSGLSEIQLNGENVESQIRTLEVSRYVSQVAALPAVREKLVEQQQLLGNQKGVVMDGRDIGTVVFPDAELKIFMTASAEKRAQRRYLELLERGEEVSYEDVLNNVKERDRIDATRATSPLKQADDAIPFDNSDMNLEQQFQAVYEHALRVIEQDKKSAL